MESVDFWTFQQEKSQLVSWNQHLTQENKMKYLFILIISVPLIAFAGEHAGKSAEHAGKAAEAAEESKEHAGKAAEHAGKKAEHAGEAAEPE